MSNVWWTTQDQSVFRYSYQLSCDEDGVMTLLPRGEEKVEKVSREKALNRCFLYELTVFFPGIQHAGTKHAIAVPGNEVADGNHKPDSAMMEGYCANLKTMFKAFYRQRFHGPTQDDEFIALAVLADYYDALHSISGSILVSIFELSDFEERIERNPLKFLYLGYKLQSARIFNESFVHFVGIYCGRLDAPITTLLVDFRPCIPETVACCIRSEWSRINQLLFVAMRECLCFNCDETIPRNRIYNQSIRGEIGRCFKLYGNPGQEGLLFREIADSTFTPTKADADQYLKHTRGYPAEDIRSLTEGIVNLASDLCENNLRSKKKMSYLTCARPPEITQLH